MTYTRVFAVTGLVLLGAAAGRFALANHHEGAGQPESVTLKGEVIDLQCALLHPDAAAGSDHATCAKACIGKGLPAGLKVGDQVYLLIAKDHMSVKHLVAKHAGTMVEVTGIVAERYGLKALRADSVTSTKAATESKPVAKDVWMCPMGCVKSDKPGDCSACGMKMEKQKKS